MASNAPQARTKSRNRPPATIGFRLKEPHLRLLLEQAARMAISPHELAQMYVREALEERPEREALFLAITRLREELATVAEALLIKAGKVPPKDAHAWVEETFRNSCSPSPTP